MLMHRINGVILRLSPRARAAQGGQTRAQAGTHRCMLHDLPAHTPCRHRRRPRPAPSEMGRVGCKGTAGEAGENAGEAKPDAGADRDNSPAAVQDGVQDKGEGRIMYLPFLTARGLASSLDARRKLRHSQRSTLFDALNDVCRLKSGLPRCRPRLRSRRLVELESISERAPDAKEVGPADVLGQRPRLV